MSSYVQGAFGQVGGNSPRPPREKLSVQATIDPANHNSSTQTSDTIDMQQAGLVRAVFFLVAGAIDNTIDFKAQESANADGSGAVDLAGKAIVQEAGGDDDNKQWMISVYPHEVSERYVRASVTSGAGTVNMLGLIGLAQLVGTDGQGDLASVSQIIP